MDEGAFSLCYNRVFTLDMDGTLKKIFSDTCEQMQCELLEYGFVADHAYLIVYKVAVSNF